MVLRKSLQFEGLFLILKKTVLRVSLASKESKPYSSEEFTDNS